MALEPEIFGPYRVLRSLAPGGMARVSLAVEELFEGVERLVVLKRLSPERRSDEEYVTMFFDEVRLLSTLNHPGVPQVFAAGTIGVEPYIALEYIPGASLMELLAAAHGRGQRLPEAEALSILRSLAETLAYVHGATDEYGRSLRMVHRDVTPANVLVGVNGTVKLIDFGIARGEARIYQTSTGVLKGTLGYMAPEQLIEGEPGDHRVDIFSFGVVLYEALVGAHPFQAADALELHRKIHEVRCVPPRTARPELSQPLCDLIAACLARRPDDRPSHMWEVAARLRDVLVQSAGVPLGAEVGALPRELLSDSSPATAGEGSGAPPAPEEDWVTQVDPRRQRRPR